MFRWDPTQYSQFEAERTQPVIDLLSHIPQVPAGPVIDLGCGPGNSTELLARLCESNPVQGIDSSEEMVERARARVPEAHFEVARIQDWAERESGGEGFGVVLSNAALHWLPDHDALFPRLLACLRENGVLAVQMPRNFDAPSHTCAHAVARLEAWRSRLAELHTAPPVGEPAYYHDLLAPRAQTVSIWETIYVHCFEDAEAIVQWTLGTALRPYLDRLEASEHKSFLDAYRAEIQRAYPKRASGLVLMPFRRLFLVAVR